MTMAADVYINKILADPLLAPFFEGVSLQKLHEKQVCVDTRHTCVHITA